MGELYLSSRAEVLRSMNIDTGRKTAIIGAPEDFIVWINKILPIHTQIVGIPSDIGADPIFDIILWWKPNGAKKKEIEELVNHLTIKGDLWMIIKRGISNIETDIIDTSSERTLMITPTLDLVPVILQSIPRGSKVR